MDLYNQNKTPDGYDMIAQNLATGHGYRFYPDTARTMMREPGYPFLLAAAFYFFGDSIAVIKAANVLLAFATAGVIARIAHQVTGRPLVAVLAPTVFLFHPATLIAESRGGAEVLFTLAAMVFLRYLSNATSNRRAYPYVISGIFLGLAVLVRSTQLLFPVFVFFYLLLLERRRMGIAIILRNVLVMALGMFVALSPWIIRNYSLARAFVPTASVLGISAHAGQYISSHLAPGVRWVDLDRQAARERSAIARERGYQFREGYYQYFYSSTDELRFSHDLTTRVIGTYRSAPLLLVKCVSLNALSFWFAGKTWMATLINILIEGPLLLVAGIGGVIAVKRYGLRTIGPHFLFVGYLVIVSMPILAQARYSVPALPVLSFFVSVAFADTMDRTRQGKWRVEYGPEGNVVEG